MIRKIASAATLIASAWAWTPAVAWHHEGHRDFWDAGWGWGHMFVGAIGMILFWAIVISLVVFLVRRLGGGRNTTASEQERPTALDILKERYAKGEIDRDEYEQRRRDLGR